MQELRRWSAMASGHYARQWGRLGRAGLPEQAVETRRWAEALDAVNRALRLYD